MKALVLTLALLLTAATLTAQEAKLEITKLTRDIYLKGKYVRFSYDIELQNNGPVATKKYLHSVHPGHSAQLIDVLAFTKEFSELPLAKEVKENSTIYSVDLPALLPVGQKVSVKVLELYKNRLVPKPPKLALSSVRHFF